jgi:hypothetical protein
MKPLPAMPEPDDKADIFRRNAARFLRLGHAAREA